MVVNQLAWGCEFVAKAARDLIKHVRHMRNFKIPVLTANLFVSDVHTGLLNDCAPCALDQAIAGLAVSRDHNDPGLVCVDPFEGLPAYELLVKVGVEGLGKTICSGMEPFKHCNNGKEGEGSHFVQPAIARADVNEEEDVAVTTKGEEVSMADVYVDFSR